MQLAPKLKPFWFEPEFQATSPPVRFRMRPLTQEEMIEVEALYKPAEDPRLPAVWTREAQFRAAMLSIEACDGILDEDGEPIRWPFDINRPGAAAHELRDLIVHSGMRIITEMNGGDWDSLIAKVRKRSGDLDVDKPQQPAELNAEKT